MQVQWLEYKDGCGPFKDHFHTARMKINQPDCQTYFDILYNDESYEFDYISVFTIKTDPDKETIPELVPYQNFVTPYYIITQYKNRYIHLYYPGKGLDSYRYAIARSILNGWDNLKYHVFTKTKVHPYGMFEPSDGSMFINQDDVVSYEMDIKTPEDIYINYPVLGLDRALWKYMAYQKKYCRLVAINNFGAFHTRPFYMVRSYEYSEDIRKKDTPESIHKTNTNMQFSLVEPYAGFQDIEWLYNSVFRFNPPMETPPTSIFGVMLDNTNTVTIPYDISTRVEDKNSIPHDGVVPIVRTMESMHLYASINIDAKNDPTAHIKSGWIKIKHPCELPTPWLYLHESVIGSSKLQLAEFIHVLTYSFSDEAINERLKRNTRRIVLEYDQPFNGVSSKRNVVGRFGLSNAIPSISYDMFHRIYRIPYELLFTKHDVPMNTLTNKLFTAKEIYFKPYDDEYSRDIQSYEYGIIDKDGELKPLFKTTDIGLCKLTRYHHHVIHCIMDVIINYVSHCVLEE